MITLPRVAIHSKIYESSASLVYRGIREQDNCAVVVKVLKQDYPSPQELTRYRQEYEITRSLNIKGVVRAYSQQDYERTLVILLEDFGGESLEHWMQQQSGFCPMPLSTFLGLAIDLTEILGRIHAANIIHRDINPGNIILNLNTGVVKMIDFGIATRFSRTNPTFKSLHLLEGTPAYLSPEQTGRMNRMLDYRTDFYSLGVTFYELLTGQLPFPTRDILELVHCHIAKPPAPLHELNAAIPKPVSDMILKLMAKNAEDRYQSAWGIKADLERCAQQWSEMGQIDSIQLGLQDVSEQFHIPQKLYGREVEIAALLAAFDRVAERNDTERGRGGPEEDITPSPHREMMLVSGYAGIGKTALVQELYKPITAKQGYFISGKFDQLERNIPYSAIVDALQKLVQQLLGEPDEQVQQWRSRLLTALGSNGQIIIDVIPEVELIIGKQPPVPEVGATEAQNRFNLIFQRFVRVFCAKEHSLVIFLDDLQWIDSATLKLIELILLDEQTQCLFLIGAYRDNEVTPTHPLVLTLERLRNQGAVLQEIILTPLTLEPLSQLMAETLHHNTDTVRSLAQVVLRKTEGNPFFVGEFLQVLYSENLLTFDPPQSHASCFKSAEPPNALAPLTKGGSKGGWQWNLAEIEAQAITDNVVELLLLQLKKLPEATQQLLCLAACVGSEFDLETLAIVGEKLPKAIFQDLLAAIQAGLIQPLSELDEDLLVQAHKFSHDRFQQAAYALIDASQRQVVHLQIGHNLFEKTLPDQLSDQLFAIVDHLNQGIELVNDQGERTEIARLNLMAGQKAKAATAYEAALKYFNTGLKLLNPESWQSEYELTLALYSEAARAAYLHGRFGEMEQFVEVVLNHAKTVVDKVQVYDSRIQRYLSQGNLEEALKIGLEVLQLLQVILIETPSQLDVQKGLKETAALLAGREIEDLINLPKMTAPEPLAAIYILTNIAVAASMVSPALMILIVCKMINLSINYGNATWSPLSYASYGVVLGEFVQDIELGYKFGQLALSLAERLNTKKGSSKVLTIFSANVMHWKVNFRKTVPILVDAYQNGVETGDFEFAGYAAYNVCFYSFLVGEELTELEQKTATYSKAIRQIRQENTSNQIAMLWQTILNLLGKSENPSRLIGSAYDEEQASLHAIAVKDETGIDFFYFNKVVLCYLFGEYHQAAKTAELARQSLEELSVPIFHFYDSLVLLSLLVEASSSEKSAWLSCVNTNQEKVQKWAEHAPMNYLHKFHLVEAEKARVLGQFLEAEEFYERAISGASENEFIQEEALAYELAAKHYLARGREKIARTYMQEAHYCYDRWGATAKVKDLENRYPQLLNSNLTRQSNLTLTDETIRRPTAAIDLAAVMKAAQALSEMIHLDHLIATLMQVVIENAGAETGALILLEDDQLTVVAQCSSSRQCDLEKTTLAGCATIPVSIIHSVERTQEALVFDNAVSEPSFLTDPCIQHQQTRSLLCMPILKQRQLIGMLYLENNLSTGVFTSDRLEVLKLLIAQAAISLENAQLYQRLENYSETLERKVEARTQALQQEITERQQTEAALRQSEANYRNLVQTANSIILCSDTQGRIRYLNDYGLKFFGYEDHQILGRTLLETIIPETETSGRDLKQFVHGLFHNLKSHLPKSYLQTENENLCRDGRRVWVAWSNQAILNEQGQLVEILSVGNDITQRKQAEEALQRSEAKFRSIFENSQVGIFRTRLSDGLILDANQRFANLFGFNSPNEIIGIECSPDFYANPSDRQQAIELLERDGELQNFEVQLRKRDGTTFWGLYSARLNAADGCVEGVIADISDRKQAEAALRESEQLLDVSFSQSLDGFFIMMLDQPVQWDDTVNKDKVLDYVFAHKRVTKANDAILAQYGVSQEQFIGFTPNDLFAHDLAYGKQVWREFFDAGKLYIETDERRLDGTSIWIEGNYICLYDSQGRIIGHFGVQRDISDRKRAEAALRDVYDELRLREQELRLITDALPVYISYVDADQRYRFVNHAYEVWFKRSRDEIIGKSVREIQSEAAYQITEPYIQQLLGGQTTSFEAEIPEGSNHYVSATHIPHFGADGQVKGYYGLITDISEAKRDEVVRKQAEAVLRQSEAQFREQAILSAFRADVDSALAQGDSLPLMLHRCAEAVVQHFNAAFARIWTLNKDKTVLELQASAGMYTRLDGTHSRIPVGSFKVGRIAQDRCPLLTNNVFDEPSINHEWAEREGMVAFAGYPILLDEQLVGVVATFTRHPIPLSYFEALEFAAREMALGIKRKQAEVALQVSEAELRALFSAIPDPLFVINAEGRIVRATLIASEKVYRPIDEQVNRTLHEIFERPQADTFLGYIQQALTTQQFITAEYSLLVGEQETWFAAHISPLSNDTVIWLARDITDRKRAEEASILEERNRMAREIHDTLAQAFTGVLVHMGAVSRLATTNPEAIQLHIKTVRDLARSGLTEARRSVAALRPQLLEEGNLWTALERFVSSMQFSTETRLSCEIIGTPYALPPETENNLLRIGQEAFTNAVKYAHANEIRIELVYEPTQCCLRISDNGQGFEVNNTTLSQGFGLLGMTERAEHIGAQLSIESELGQGTDVIVSVHREVAA